MSLAPCTRVIDMSVVSVPARDVVVRSNVGGDEVAVNSPLEEFNVVVGSFVISRAIRSRHSDGLNVT